MKVTEYNEKKEDERMMKQRTKLKKKKKEMSLREYIWFPIDSTMSA